jgi:hypothetical protein
MELEKIFTNQTFDKARVYKEHLKPLTTKKKKIQLKTGKRPE